MDYLYETARKIPVVRRSQILVCGGGIAGVAAAFCAAKQGAEVLLIEKYGFLGGLVTAGLVITTPPLNNGFNLEIARRFKERGVLLPCRDSGEELEWLQMHAFDPEIAKYEFMEMLLEKSYPSAPSNCWV